jgi:hypothetical protein
VRYLATRKSKDDPEAPLFAGAWDRKMTPNSLRLLVKFGAVDLHTARHQHKKHEAGECRGYRKDRRWLHSANLLERPLIKRQRRSRPREGDLGHHAQLLPRSAAWVELPCLEGIGA